MTDSKKAKIIYIGAFHSITGDPIGWAFEGGPALVVKDGKVLPGGYTVEELRKIAEDANGNHR